MYRKVKKEIRCDSIGLEEKMRDLTESIGTQLEWINKKFERGILLPQPLPPNGTILVATNQNPTMCW